MIEQYLQDLQGNASSYGYYDMLFGEVLFELLDHHRDILRLDRDENNVSVFDNLQASKELRLSPGGKGCARRAGKAVDSKSVNTCVRAGVRSVGTKVLENLFALLADVSGPDTLCVNFLFCDKPLSESFGHITRPNESNLLPDV